MKCNYEHGQHILAHTEEFSTVRLYVTILVRSIKTYCCSTCPSDYLCLCLKATKLPQNFQYPQVTTFVRHKTLNHPSLHKVCLIQHPFVGLLRCLGYTSVLLKYSRKKLVLSRTMNGDASTAWITKISFH